MEQIESVLKLVHEMRGDFEKGILSEEKQARIETVLDGFEAKNAEVVELKATIEQNETQLTELKTSLEEKGVEAGKIREEVDALEVKFAKSFTVTKDGAYGASEEYKTFGDYIKEGTDKIPGEEVKAVLRTDSATEGGVLVVGEMESQMIKYINELDPVRSIARVRPVSAKQLTVAVETGIAIAAYEGEAEEGIESNPTYGSETLTAFRQTHTIPITRDMLMDSSFDMESEIMMNSARAFSLGEGRGFVVGSGHKQPQGFLVDPRVVAGAMASLGGSGVISADDMLKVQGEVKDGYQTKFVFNRRTLASLRMLKASDDHYLWAPALDGAATASIAGVPYVIANSMPDIAGDSLPVAYGDFREGYMIVDRTATEVIRDDYTQKKKAIVEFTMHRWNTGKVVNPEAIKLVQINS